MHTFEAQVLVLLRDLGLRSEEDVRERDVVNAI